MRQMFLAGLYGNKFVNQSRRFDTFLFESPSFRVDDSAWAQG